MEKKKLTDSSKDEFGYPETLTLLRPSGKILYPFEKQCPHFVFLDVDARYSKSAGLLSETRKSSEY